MKKYKIKTEPTTEPITLAELKLFLKIDVNTEDDLLTSLIQTGRKTVENYTGRSLITQTWEMQADNPFTGTYLSKYPIISIDSVKTFDSDSTESTVTNTDYRLETISNRIVFNDNYTYPSDLRSSGAILVTYTAGYGDADDVPEPIKQAIKNLAGILYDCRGSCEEMPVICKTLLHPFVDLAQLGACY